MKVYSVRGAAPIRKPKKKRKAASKKLRALRAAKLKAFGKQLEQSQIPSEIWFKQRFAQHDQDLFNVPLGQFIPDVHNSTFKYVIEIDGSIHDTPAQRKRDLKKDSYFLAWGYQVIRIKAYDEASLVLGLERICALRAK